MVDALDSKSNAAMCVGSSPTSGTHENKHQLLGVFSTWRAGVGLFLFLSRSAEGKNTEPGSNKICVSKFMCDHTNQNLSISTAGRGKSQLHSRKKL